VTLLKTKAPAKALAGAFSLNGYGVVNSLTVAIMALNVPYNGWTTVIIKLTVPGDVGAVPDPVKVILKVVIPGPPTEIGRAHV
jgi:hypothetical protein